LHDGLGAQLAGLNVQAGPGRGFASSLSNSHRPRARDPKPHRTSTEAYEEAVSEVFDALDHWDEVLSSRRYLCGDRITEADWCLFPTLVRFDSVYHGHFKCNLRRIVDYSNLWGYLKDFYQSPGVAETVNVDHIQKHYYGSHESINPTRIVPKGPNLDFTEAHDRGRFSDQMPQRNGYTRSV
jgi:glutathionyl-hydroquinone reductase